MKTVKLSEVKVGDRLADSTPNKYGQTREIMVEKIETTKGGRIWLWVSYVYYGNDGEVIPKAANKLNFSNGALSPNSPVNLY